MSSVHSHAALISVSGMSPRFAICVVNRHSTSVGGIFMHVLVFQENACAIVSGRLGTAHLKSQGFIKAETLLSAIPRNL